MHSLARISQAVSISGIRRFSSAAPTKLQFQLVTSDHCSLCFHFKKHFGNYVSSRGLDWTLQEVDIQSDKDLFEKYKYDIPVLLLDGNLVLKHRFSRILLERHLGIYEE
ncbi:hypothetical protein L596_020175 [Steinernema carpocapsae]|uniref:Glutaredoxin-like protein n=1 Tax=Steinernema carpocapsae TaxID=34508 RepID=A0A4U5MSS1_STECR|nr:hypothetical protein L596_020175 [Steinernema carpocapsae]